MKYYELKTTMVVYVADSTSEDEIKTAAETTLSMLRFIYTVHVDAIQELNPMVIQATPTKDSTFKN